MLTIPLGEMGRPSVQQKRKNRASQKLKKKLKQKRELASRSNAYQSSLQSITSPPALPSLSDSEKSEDSSQYTFGSPGSPPPSPIPSVSQQSIATQQDELFGLDMDAFQYELDLKNNFDFEDGSFLSGDELIEHLKQYNLKLSKKVGLYQKRCELLQKNVSTFNQQTKDKIESIRHFYRNMMFYGCSMGAKMVKASINKSIK